MRTSRLLFLIYIVAVRDNDPTLLEDTTIADVLKTFEDFYAKKDFKSALETIKIKPESLSEGLWHYNLGLTYARLENYPEARFHFLSAQKAGLNTSEVSQNDNLAAEKLDLGKLEKPTSSSDYFFKGVKFLSGGEFTTISLLILLIGMISLRKKMSWRKFGVVVVISALPLLMSFVAASWPEAVVMTNAKIQEGPSAIFGVITEVPAGVKVMTQGQGAWKKIIYPARFSGWVDSRVLKELE